MGRKRGAIAPKIVEQLLKKRYMTRRDLSIRLDMSADHIFTSISALRKRGWQIFTTSRGYTLRPKAEDLLYESKIRYRGAYGTLANGEDTMKKALQVSQTKMLELVKQYAPQITNVVNVITYKKEESQTEKRLRIPEKVQL